MSHDTETVAAQAVPVLRTPQPGAGLLALAAEQRGPYPVPGAAHLQYRFCAEFIPASASETGRIGALPDAAVCMLSYVTLEQEHQRRPVCFVFNGGPGASSAFLNVGALGPRRLVMPGVAGTRTGPARLQDNHASLLHSADLVFVDPPDTGFSRLLSDTAADIFSVDGDARILVDAIRAWLDRHGRWASPVYLCGESYGGARAAAASNAALDHGIAVAGLLLIAPALDMQPVLCASGNDMALALRLPSYAATAFHHQRASDITVDSAAAAYRKVEQLLALDHPVPALHGVALAQQLAALVGIPASELLRKKFLVHPNDYSACLLADAQVVTGKMDSRVIGPASAVRPTDDDDAAIDAVYAPIATAIRIVLRSELRLGWSCSYEVFSHGTWGAWRWNRDGASGNQFTSTSADLAGAMRRNPAMRVWVASGRYDLVTPTTSVDWSLARLDVSGAARAAIEHHVFESGHMIYTDDLAHQQMMDSMHSWFVQAV